MSTASSKSSVLARARSKSTVSAQKPVPQSADQDSRPEATVRVGLWRVLLVTTSLAVVLVSSYQMLSPPEYHPGWSRNIAIACILWLGAYIACTYQLFRTVYLFSSAYVAGLILFHLGITVPDAFGWFEDLRWQTGPLAGWLERSGWYTVLALGCLGIGFGAALRSSDFSAKYHQTNPELAHNRLSAVYWAGLGLLAASAIFLGIGIRSFGNLLEYSRMDFFRGVHDTRGVGGFLQVFPTATLMLVIGARKRTERITATTVAVVGLPILLLSGYRSMAMFPFLAAVVLWTKTGRKVPLWFAAGAVITMVIAISVVGVLRAVGPYSAIDKDAAKSALEGATIQDTFALGVTGEVLANVLRLVPDTDPYRYGTTYLGYLRSSIPNVMSRKRESGLTNDGTDVADSLPPASWITYRLDRAKFRGGEGYGFTAIGEPYMNFGTAGVVLFFVGLGYLLARLESTNLLNHPRWLFFACVAYWPLLKTVRNDFGVFFKPVVFSLIVILIWRLTTFLFVSPRR